MFIDTHCHLHDEKLKDTDAVVDEYLKDGVEIAINAACCALTSEKGKELAEKQKTLYLNLEGYSAMVGEGKNLGREKED